MPAVAVIRGGQALTGIIRRKALVGESSRCFLNSMAQPSFWNKTDFLELIKKKTEFLVDG